jgi:ribosomal-protein-alanine N-acetyltransferase
LRNEGTALLYLEINGVWEDHVRYAITSEDWADKREQYLKDWVLPI